jgi:hypothetical protein
MARGAVFWRSPVAENAAIRRRCRANNLLDWMKNSTLAPIRRDARAASPTVPMPGKLRKLARKTAEIRRSRNSPLRLVC